MSATTKEKILDVALNVFSEVGYEGTTTREICKRAEVNVAALNYHWGSKEKLWLAACQWAGSQLTTLAKENLDPSDHPREVIEKVLGAVFDHLARDSRSIRIITWASLQADYLDFGMAAENFQPFVQFGMAYFENLAEQGIIADVDYEVILATFWGQFLVAFIDEPGHRVYFGRDYSDPNHVARFRKTLVQSALSVLGLKTPPRRKPAAESDEQA